MLLNKCTTILYLYLISRMTFESRNEHSLTYHESENVLTRCIFMFMKNVILCERI